jgi:hypothetical protein
MGVTFIAGHTLLKFVRGQVIQELCENGAAGIHPPFCGGAGHGLPSRFLPFLISNRKIHFLP